MQSEDGLSTTIRTLFQDKQVQEALFLGSPTLHRRCLEWLNGEVSNIKEERKLMHSLLRYYLRMSTRCTPFGLFAACSLGRWGKEGDLVLSEKTFRSTRLDMHYFCALSLHLEADKRIRPYLQYFANSSLYLFGDKIRFVEYYYKDGGRHHQISAVQSSPYLLALLNTAKEGASFDELAQVLMAETEDAEEARSFVHEVIDSQLLVSELEPAITGEDQLQQLLATLNRICDQQAGPSKNLRQTIAVLTRVKNYLDHLDQQQSTDNYPVYRRIAAELDQLGVPYDISKLFQVDMGRKTQCCQLPYRLAGSIRKGLEVLNRLHSRKNDMPYHIRRYQARSNLQRFQEAFFQRYETKEMPLLQVLDNESGIGYLQSTGPGDTHPMIDDIQTLYPEVETTIQLGDRESFLLKKLLAASQQGDYEVKLQDEELKAFEPVWEDLPDTFSVIGAVLGRAGTDGTAEKIYINSAGGSSAANLLGRFTHLDPEIDKYTSSITQLEQDLHPDVCFAEIVHLPQARTGNILMRTCLRQYEIPFLAKSSVQPSHKIALQDLWLSVIDDRLILHSKKLNKEIIPRLSTAHNYSLSSLPAYHFLCDLQFQQLPGRLYHGPPKWVAGDVADLRHRQIIPNLSFHWGQLEQQFRFLPRVSYYNLILKRAAWNLVKEDYQELLEPVRRGLLDKIRLWRQALKMPRYIVIADYDNELFVDLESPACLGLFIRILKKKPSVLLKEFLFDPDSVLVRDEQGNTYTNEIIMAFARKKEQGVDKHKAAKSKEFAIPRSFPPGSEWLYYKFYAGAQSIDELLSSYVLPLTRDLMQQGLIDHWFFIRYADPDLHLRLRFHLSDIHNVGQAINFITEYMSPASTNRKTWRVQIDTYEREVERYGPRTMALSEAIFHHDSVAIVHFLDQVSDYEDPELLRWFFAMLNIDTLLSSFRLNLEAKTVLLKKMRTSFATEFNINNKLGTTQLSVKYREHRKTIEDIVQGNAESFPEEVITLLKNKSSAIEPICREITDIAEAEQLQTSFQSFLSSHIHMLMNRLFRSQQRKYELVVYEMLYRAYSSVLARAEPERNV